MKIDRLTFIAHTKEVSINGEKYIINIEKIEPENLRAIQWYGSSENPWGEYEYDGENNIQFFDFSVIEALVPLWESAKNKRLLEIENNQLIEEKLNNRYDRLRAREYPDVASQVGAIMKLLNKMILDKKIDSIPEFDEIYDKIQEVKLKYPNTDLNKSKNKKSK